MPGDGGKKAPQSVVPGASKPEKAGSKLGLERKLEDDELFKQIGGQLGGKFDYTEWQRSERPGLATKQTTGSQERFPAQRKKEYPQAETTYLTVGPGGSAFQIHRPVSAPQYRQKPRKGKPTVQAVRPGVDKAKAERLRILQLRIQTRRQTLLEYRKRKERLLEDNIRLKDEIQEKEGEAHDEVKKLLRKYERFRGGIFTLNEKFTQELAEAKEDYDVTKIRTDGELMALEHEVQEASDRLKRLQDELYILLNYKDKEYPVKQLRITELQKEMEQLAINQQEDEDELQHVVESEIDKYRKDHQCQQRGIMEKVTKTAIDQMHPSLKDMAMQNMVMQKELEFHQKEIEQLESMNKDLKAEVEALLKNPKTNIKMQMFPEFYPTREKCTPDMDVVLDIPTQEWLPI